LRLNLHGERRRRKWCSGGCNIPFNTVPQGGALYFHNSNLVIKASTLSANSAAGSGGALFADGTTLSFTNDTFADNIAEKGLGGAIYLSGNGGTLQNLTFLGN
jgi:predicted outer membrane repeat protein